jgi:prevent-host-death family protein
MTTLTSRELSQDTGRAKKAAKHGPVFITDRGQPRYVLLSIEEYCRLTGASRSIADLLAMPGAEDIDLELPSLRDLPRAADLS